MRCAAMIRNGPSLEEGLQEVAPLRQERVQVKSLGLSVCGRDLIRGQILVRAGFRAGGADLPLQGRGAPPKRPKMS